MPITRIGSLNTYGSSRLIDVLCLAQLASGFISFMNPRHPAWTQVNYVDNG